MSANNTDLLKICFFDGVYNMDGLESPVELELKGMLSSLWLMGVNGTGKNVVLNGLGIYLKGGESDNGFSLIIEKLTLVNQTQIGQPYQNSTSQLISYVLFSSVTIGTISTVPDTPAQWSIMAQHIELLHCRANTVFTGPMQFITGDEGSVNITGLVWENVTGLNVGFYISTAQFDLWDSMFQQSSSDNSLFIVTSSSNSLTVTVKNSTFNYIEINDPTFFDISGPNSVGNINIINSTFTCNTYTGDDPDLSGLVLPFFDTDSLNPNITSLGNSIPLCPIQCPSSTLERNSMLPLWPCQSCNAGNGSVNYTCMPCPVHTFSMAGICEEFPIYSGQTLTGQDHCNCFSNSKVDDSNSNRCNNEVWGIIIAGIYLVVIGTIICFRRPKKKQQYHVIERE